MKRNFLVFILIITGINFHAQQVGLWTDHFSYNNITRLCAGQSNEIIGLSENGIIIFNSSDQSFQKISKTNGLNDVAPTAVAFISSENTIVIGYQNGNIDILKKSGTINVPDFKLSNTIGNKAIVDIQIDRRLAYLSTGIGLLVLDLENFEIKNTALLGPNGISESVLHTAISNDHLFSVGPRGVISIAANNPFLANFQNWNNVFNAENSTIVSCTHFQDNIFIIVQDQTGYTLWKGNTINSIWEPISIINSENTPRSIWANGNIVTVSLQDRYVVFNHNGEIVIEDNQNDWLFLSPNHIIQTADNKIWIGNSIYGLGTRSIDGTERIHTPTGPFSNTMRKVNPYNDNVWLATGNVYPWWGNTYTYCFQSAYLQNAWLNESFGNGANTFGNGVFDVLDVAVDPTNNQRILFGSWEEGLIERESSGKINYFNSATNNNPLNSSIDTAVNWTAVGSVQFDLNGNAWIANSFSENPIVVYTSQKEFKAFSFGNLVSKSDIVEQVYHSQAGYVYAIVRGKGILALNYNGTLDNKDDDIFKLLVDKEGQGGLPTKDVYSIVEDLDGNIWLGTIKGVAVFYNQEAIFSDENFDAEQILITQDGNVQILLETEAINNIEIDGGNNKWIATQNNGVYRISADGLTQLAHYTKDNTPLPTNNVYDVGINQANGQIFFATDRGLIAFTGDATNFDNKMEKVFAYPNPVGSDYQGLISIQGLAYESEVRITDIGGKLIFSGKSEGGRCVWNGKNLSGDRPQPGVYIIMAGDSQGDVKNVCKIAFDR